jgi:DNA modification methylase
VTIEKNFQISDIKPIHPFPARMAPSIVWESIPCNGSKMRVLDPMAGSGTTLVSVRAMGHQAIGCDTDPLALLIARSWCSNLNPNKIRYRAELVLERAMRISENLAPEKAYPPHIDLETREFIDYWFDDTNRCQITALAKCISRVRDYDEKTLLWCALSRLIITKKSGVSLAMDISHSRPHKKYEEAPVRAFGRFLHAVDYIVDKAPFRKNNDKAPNIVIRKADARALPFESNSVDMVITSPPYINAIDYIRGHKFSLVWMGYSIATLRALRSSNIGAECSVNLDGVEQFREILERMGDIKKLDRRRLNMVIRYIVDMNHVIAECRRVMKRNGQAIFVIGDCTIGGVFIRNSECLIRLGNRNGLELSSRITRQLPENRRYLPPPNLETSGHKMQSRIREEVILHFN